MEAGEDAIADASFWQEAISLVDLQEMVSDPAGKQACANAAQTCDRQTHIEQQIVKQQDKLNAIKQARKVSKERNAQAIPSRP
jgi:hypothetical protein